MLAAAYEGKTVKQCFMDLACLVNLSKIWLHPRKSHQLNPEQSMNYGKVNYLFCVQIPLS